MNNEGTIFKVRIEVITTDDDNGIAVCERQFTHPSDSRVSLGWAAGRAVCEAFLGVIDHMEVGDKQQEDFMEAYAEHDDVWSLFQNGRTKT